MSKELATAILNTQVKKYVLSGDALMGHDEECVPVRELLGSRLGNWLERNITATAMQLESAIPRADYELLTEPMEKMFASVTEDVEERINKYESLLKSLPGLNNALAQAKLDRPADAGALREAAEAIGAMIEINQEILVNLGHESPAQIAAALALPPKQSEKFDDEAFVTTLEELMQGKHQKATQLEHFDDAHKLQDTLHDMHQMRVEFWTKLQSDLLTLANELGQAKSAHM